MKAYRFAWLGAWMLLPFLLAAPSHAAVIFSDNFNDGDTVGWTFIGNDAGEWGNTGTQLNSSAFGDDAHDANLGIAYITGVTTPNHFRLSADVSVIGASQGGELGHVGFVWGFDGNSYVYGSNAVAHYLRTHADHVTTFSYPYIGEATMPIGINALLNTPYKMAIEVDYANKFMDIIFNGASVGTLSGAAFDTYVKYSGGNIGLVNWGEEVTYDNVVLEDLSVAGVPEPSSLTLLGMGAVSLVGYGWRKKRNQAA